LSSTPGIGTNGVDGIQTKSEIIYAMHTKKAAGCGTIFLINAVPYGAVWCEIMFTKNEHSTTQDMYGVGDTELSGMFSKLN